MGSRRHRSRSTTTIVRPNVAFGPGDCVCTNYTDPRKLIGCNLPSRLNALLGDLKGEDSDDWSDLDIDPSGLDSMSSSDEEPPLPPLPPRSPSPAGPTPKDDDDEDRPPVPIRKRQKARDANNGTEAQKTNGVADDDIYQRDSRVNRQRTRSPSAWPQSLEITISALAFGSRFGDYGIIYSQKNDSYLEGPIFERINDLRTWVLPDLPEAAVVNRTLINKRNGNDIRLFLGPESTYFIYDNRTGEFNSNIQAREFRAWLQSCTQPGQDNTVIRRGYSPHSLALGPKDMFCWISETAYKTNKAFKTAFPSIERYLAFARVARKLKHVSLSMSTDAQPGAKLPYFVLTTADGVAVSSVPADAADLIATATLKYGALKSAQQTRDVKRLTRATKSARKALEANQKTIADFEKGLKQMVSQLDNDVKTLNPRELHAKIKEFLNNILNRRPSRSRSRSRSRSPDIIIRDRTASRSRSASRSRRAAKLSEQTERKGQHEDPKA